MKNFEEVFSDLLADTRKVEVSEVARTVATTIGLLDRRSENFARVKKESPKGYIGLLNTLTLTLIANLSVIGKDEAEVRKFGSEIKDDCVRSMAVLAVGEGEVK